MAPNQNIKTPEKDRQKTRLFAIACSFVVGAAIMALKFYVYRLTQSSAVLSDALESIINVVASAFALFSIIMAARPPDRSHPYGHGKIEYFSAGFEGALIIIAAFGIFRIGVQHLLYPRTLPNLQMGLWILSGVTFINLILGIGLKRVGEKTDSLTLVADGKHVLTDVYSSAGVLAGLLLVHLSGLNRLDGLVACIVGINILVTGAGLVRTSFAGLMDASDPDLLKQVSALILEHRKEIWIDVHELRAWRSGNRLHIDLHLILPCNLSLDAAHREAKLLEKVIVSYFGGKASVLIHMDPCEDPDCVICSRYSCGLRSHKQTAEIPWTWKTLTTFGGAGERLKNAHLRLRK
jgi:cation diffusion facilitator family transporter